MKDSRRSLCIVALGLWVFLAPMSFGYTACHAMWASDLLSGFFLMLFGFIAIKKNKAWPLGLCALAGLWLQLAPLVFWAPQAVAYASDTLVGMSVILLVFSSSTFSDEEKGEEIPPGWSFNPSALGPRWTTVFLALIAWFLARYLASYQLGYIETVKDPFFGEGSLKVISSSVAKMFPVSDAGLGALGYSLECILGIIGSSRRWKTMPWLAVFFGMMVIPAGAMSILLIVLQPLAVGAWCGICLMIAFCMLFMILLTIPEMTATLQVLQRAKKRKMFWTVFWKGDISSSGQPSRPVDRNITSILGFTASWSSVLSVLLGVWCMSSPYIFGDASPASDVNYATGPLIVAFSILSFSEIARPLRWVVAALGCLLMFSSFCLEGFSSLGFVSNLVSGVLFILFSCCTSKKRESYGSDN